MNETTTSTLIDVFRSSGLWTEEQIASAETLCASTHDIATVADQLWSLECLTKYQYAKLRNNRLIDLIYGPYLVIDKIGEGGMGKVYKAVETGTGRLVALKTIRPQLIANKTVVKRYEREAKAALSLHHPNVVAMYDATVVDGRFIMAMEFVEGIDLGRMVKEFGRPPEVGMPDVQEICEYMRQAALGLSAIHALGFVHRDIKPSNILVSGERPVAGSNGVASVKLLDMGLVRQILDTDEASRSELTRDGTVVGTPDYMAPEQAKNSSTVDHRADLYSLGCTFYFLLRGRPPFPDGSPLDKLIRHQLDSPPDLRPLRPDVPDAVIRIVERLLSKKPQERFPSATDLAKALAPFAAGGSSAQASDGPVQTFFHISLEPDPPSDSTPHDPTKSTPEPSGTSAQGTANTATPKATKKVVLKAVVPPQPPGSPATPASGTIAPRRLVPTTPSPPPTRSSAKEASIPKTPTAGAESARSASPASSGHLQRVATPLSTQKPKTPISSRTSRKLRKSGSGHSVHTGQTLMILGGIGILAIVGIAFAVLRSGEHHQAVTPVMDQPAPVAATSRYNFLLPAARLFAPGTVAGLVVYPQPLWAAARSKPLGSTTKTQLDAMTKTACFDTRLFDRTCLSWTAKKGPYLAVAEAKEWPRTWEADITARLESTPEKHPAGKLFRLDSLANPNCAAILKNQGYAISNDRTLLNQFLESWAKDSRNPPLPAGMNRQFASAFPGPENDEPPVATFAATGGWSIPIPGGQALESDGVRLIVVEARFVDPAFHLSLRLSGSDEARLKEFVSEELAKLVLHYRPLGKLIGPLIDTKKPETVVELDGTTIKYHKSYQWSEVSMVADEILTDLFVK